jgi:hypothetical protein
VWPNDLASSDSLVAGPVSPISKSAAPQVPPPEVATAVYPVVTSFWVSVSPIMTAVFFSRTVTDPMMRPGAGPSAEAAVRG